MPKPGIKTINKSLQENIKSARRDEKPSLFHGITSKVAKKTGPRDNVTTKIKEFSKPKGKSELHVLDVERIESDLRISKEKPKMSKSGHKIRVRTNVSNIPKRNLRIRISPTKAARKAFKAGLKNPNSEKKKDIPTKIPMNKNCMDKTKVSHLIEKLKNENNVQMRTKRRAFQICNGILKKKAKVALTKISDEGSAHDLDTMKDTEGNHTSVKGGSHEKVQETKSSEGTSKKTTLSSAQNYMNTKPAATKSLIDKNNDFEAKTVLIVNGSGTKMPVIRIERVSNLEKTSNKLQNLSSKIEEAPTHVETNKTKSTLEKASKKRKTLRLVNSELEQAHVKSDKKNPTSIVSLPSLCHTECKDLGYCNVMTFEKQPYVVLTFLSLDELENYGYKKNKKETPNKPINKKKSYEEAFSQRGIDLEMFLKEFNVIKYKDIKQKNPSLKLYLTPTALILK